MSESSFNPFFSTSWVGEIVNNLLNVSHAVPSFFITVICVACCFFLMFYHCPMCHMLFLPHVFSLSYVSHAVSSPCFITVLCVTCCFFPNVLSLSCVSHAVSSPCFITVFCICISAQPLTLTHGQPTSGRLRTGCTCEWL